MFLTFFKQIQSNLFNKSYQTEIYGIVWLKTFLFCHFNRTQQKSSFSFSLCSLIYIYPS